MEVLVLGNVHRLGRGGTKEGLHGQINLGNADLS